MSLIQNAKRLAACTAALLFSASIASAGIFQWSDTFVGYRYGQDFREPGNDQKLVKNIYQIQHSDGYKYGSNFLNLDALYSAGGADPRDGSTSGAAEYYFVFRSTFSAEKLHIMQTPSPRSIIRDVGLTIGFDANTKNDAFASQVRELYVGPTVSFNVPGFLTVGVLLDKENNHNGIVGKNVYFNPTYCVAVAWGIPVKNTPFTFKGFVNFMGTKGKDGFGNDTAPETLLEASIMIDPFYNSTSKKGMFYVGVGYQYWNNKFGNDATYDPTGGSRASVPQFQLEYHF